MDLDRPLQTSLYTMLEEIRNHGLATATLEEMRQAWQARLAELNRQRYDSYADLLYAYLLERLVPQKESTFNAIMARMRTASSPRELEIPLWQYTASYEKTDCDRLYETRIRTSSLPPVPVYAVTHSTDLLCRLASAYGADFYVSDRHVETLSETDQRVQSRRELVLSYYPNGLPETLSRRVLDAYTRQFNRTAYTPSWNETVRILEPLETPPPSRSSSPPPIPRRCYCEHSS